MNVVHDVTQKLGAEISKEDTGKVAVNFGEAGRQLGSLFARYQYENSQKEFSQGMPTMPNLNLNLSTPDLSNIQTAKDVEDMSFQYAQELEEATRAKASGSISDAEFNKRVSDADRRAYSKGMNLADMKKARDSVVGFNDVNNNIAVGTYMSMQEGKQQAIKEVKKGDTERHLKLGQEWTGRTDLPPDQLIQIGAQIEQDKNDLKNNPQFEAELERRGYSKEDIDKAGVITVLRYFGPFIEEAAYRLRELDPVQRYNALQRLVTDEVVSLGINLTPSQQETLTTRLSSYKNASKEDLESRKNVNDHMSENERRAKLNYYAALPTDIKETFYMAEMAGFKLAEFSPKMTEAILNFVKDGTKSPPMDAETQDKLLVMSLHNPKGSSQLPAEAQNNINKFVNKKTIENNTRTDSESVEANNKNVPTILNYYAGVDTSKLTPEAMVESKQAIKSVVNQIALKVSQELDNRFSIGVSPSGLYIALYDGKPYKASAVGEFLGTDGALLIQTVSKMNEAQPAFDNFQVSNKERLEAISGVVFSGKTTGEIAAAPLHLSNAVLGGILDIGVAGNKLLGLDPDPKAATEGKRVLNKSADAFARWVNEWTGSTGAQQHKMLEPEMTELRTNLENMTAQDLLAAIRRYKGETTEVFDESDRPTGELEDTGEPTPEIMTAALEVEGTDAYFGDGNINLNDRKVVLNKDGSFSTEESITISEGDVDVLIPTIVNGKKLSDKQAIAHYEKTGEYLKKGSPEEVEKYAKELHERQEQYYKDVAKRLLWQKNIEGKYTGVVKTGGKIPEGATLLSGEKPRKTALDQKSINKDKPAFKADVDKVVDALGNRDILVKVKTLSDGKKTEVAVPPELGLVVLGEGFTSGISKSNTIGFGTKTNIAKPLLSKMGVKLDKDTKITHEQGVGLARLYIENTVDSKIKKVIGEEAFNKLDPVRRMLARDVLFAYGPSSVNFNGYKKVGLDQYFLNILDDTKSISDILKYKPTFPPFKDKLNGVQTVFYAPYGASRLALIELFAENIEGEKGGK